MTPVPRPRLKDARRQFWWGDHDLIDHGIIAHVGPSAWAVYTCLLRHINDEGNAFPSVPLLMAETGLSNRVIAQSVARLKEVSLIDVDRASHQVNVYIILDVIHAIRKNGWKRVEKKARDEKSPARLARPLGTKQVTKSHEPRDETSPEQMTKSHPKKNHSKRTIEKGGVIDVMGDAREDHAPHTTTGDAALSKREDTPFLPTSETLITSPAWHLGVAVYQPPVGGAADAAVERSTFSLEELQRLFDDVPDQATSLEDVPGGAAVGGAGLGDAPHGDAEASKTLSVALLAPRGREELLKRPVAPVDGPGFRAIRIMLGGSMLSEVLKQPTPTGGYNREDWLRLTLTELEQVRRAAQADAQARKGNMITLAIEGLDRMIGAGPSQARGTRPGDVVPLPGAYLTREEKTRQGAGYPVVTVSEEWQGRQSGKRFRVTEVTSQSVFVEGLGEYPLQKFHKLFEQV